MARKTTTRLVTIASLERLRLSANGNPRFRVTFTDGTVAVTETDSMFAYAIENPEFSGAPHRGLPAPGLIATFTASGRLSYARPASEESE